METSQPMMASPVVEPEITNLQSLIAASEHDGDFNKLNSHSVEDNNIFIS